MLSPTLTTVTPPASRCLSLETSASAEVALTELRYSPPAFTKFWAESVWGIASCYRPVTTFSCHDLAPKIMIIQNRQVYKPH